MLALLAGVAAVVGSYALAGFTPAYVVAPVDAWLQRVMPGVVVTFAIETLGSLGQQLNLLTATGLVALVFAALARAALYVAAGARSDALAVVATAGLAWGGSFALTGALGPAAGAGLAAGGTVAVGALADGRGLHAGGDADPDRGRRRTIAALAGVVGVGSVSMLRNGLPVPSEDEGGGDVEISEGAQADLDLADERSLGVDGIEPLISESFYNVDINSVDPQVDAEEWSLSITGAVEEEITVDMDDIREMESRREFVTLRCVGENLNGKKMDTALWTGVDVRDLLERAGVDSDCECVMLRAADDYFEEFPLAAFDDGHGMLAYEMNGAPLPRSHGFPLRALVMGHWGEINVKWLDEIELLEREADGYWEQRGWHGTGPVHTVAKLHAVNDLDDGRKRVAGHAYAGVRGVSAVEVSTDGGDSWSNARLSEELPGEDVWRQWAYDYEPPGGQHEVVVRAIEDGGTVQTEEEMGSFPNGPTGWVSQTVR